MNTISMEACPRLQVMLAARVLLNDDFVDFTRRLTSHLRYRSDKRKYLLKKALRRMVPDFVLNICVDRPTSRRTQIEASGSMALVHDCLSK